MVRRFWSRLATAAALLSATAVLAGAVGAAPAPQPIARPEVAAASSALGSDDDAQSAQARLMSAPTASPSTTARSGNHVVYVTDLHRSASTADDFSPQVNEQRARTLVSALNSYWSTESHGALTFSYGGFDDIADYSSASCSLDQVMQDSARLSFNGMFLSATASENLVTFTAEDCGTGRGYINGNQTSIGDGWDGYGIPTAVHEIGHNLGLGHAGSVICKGGDHPVSLYSYTPGSTCYVEEYGDYDSVMGYTIRGLTPGLSSPDLTRLGWLEPTDVTPGPQPQRFTIQSLTGADPEALRVTDSTGGVYFIEFRTATGLDTGSASFSSDGSSSCTYYEPGDLHCTQDASVTAGQVRIVREYGSGYVQTAVLAVGAIPDFPGSFDDHLDAGQSFTSDSSRFWVDVNSENAAGGATLTIGTGAAPPSTTSVGLDAVSTRWMAREPSRVTATVESPTGGRVSFAVAGAVFATVPLNSAGQATAAVPVSIRPGRAQITATYYPSTPHGAAQSSSAVTFSVSKATTSVRMSKATTTRVTARVVTSSAARVRGKVSFYVGARRVAVATVHDGTATAKVHLRKHQRVIARFIPASTSTMLTSKSRALRVLR